jgi:hypothetical protein
MLIRISFLAALLLTVAPGLKAQPTGTTRLADFGPEAGLYRRVLGSVGTGASGVPVAGGFDMDMDGKTDYAIAAMRASPQGRDRAGQVFLVFGDNTAAGAVDTGANDPRVLEIHGDQVQENAGSEIWMADVTGNGFGDLIICRQNYSPDGSRTGAGAMTLIPASTQLRTLAADGAVLDLRSPPENLPMLNIVGALAYSRLCIWARNGDITGDGTDDLAIGADEEMTDGETHAGAVYLLRGGSWLLTAADIDLADFGKVAAGKIARVKPRTTSGSVDTSHYHFGATLQLADLDGNDVAELVVAAALARSGAGLAPAGGAPGSTHNSGGTAHGTVFIAWDDYFTGDWIPAPDFVIDEEIGSYSIINGSSNPTGNPGPRNAAFGEEILGGLDYDDNGAIDLFVGDLTGDGYAGLSRGNAGLGHVIYDASGLKGKEIELDSPPEGFTMATFLGPIAGAIAGDTALHGDFNADGIADVAFSSPMDSPFGVTNAGTLHIVLGKTGKWPVFSDLRPGSFPSSADVQIHEIYGGSGVGGGGGDVLCYSAASGDITNDGIIDLIVNEMQGDGSGSESVDAGNLIIIDSRILFKGQAVFQEGFEE